jgi:hypothetical protein
MLRATITSKGLVLTLEKKKVGTFVSVQDFVTRIPDVDLPKTATLVCSSSLDWPEDQTKDLDIIELADMIRGNNVSGRNPEFKSF